MPANKKAKYFRMDPSNDFAFKQLFGGNNRNSTLLLIDLLNSILDWPAERRIESIVYLNTFSDGEYDQSKQSIMDIKVQTAAGEVIDIEMQIRDVDNYRRRSLYYWSRLYQEQLVKGDIYDELKPCIVISILEFDLIDENPHYHSIFKLQEQERGIILNEDLEIHYLELVKLADVVEVEALNRLEQWLIFIRYAGDEKKADIINKIQAGNEVINMAGEILEKLSQDEITRQKYLAREKARMDAVSSEHYITKRALKQGEDKARWEIAARLIEQGMDNSFINQVTGLAETDIEALRQIRSEGDKQHQIPKN